MPSRFSLPRSIKAALIGLFFVFLGPTEPAFAMCGGNIFMKCPKAAKAGEVRVAPRRAAKPRRKAILSR